LVSGSAARCPLPVGGQLPAGFWQPARRYRSPRPVRLPWTPSRWPGRACQSLPRPIPELHGTPGQPAV